MLSKEHISVQLHTKWAAANLIYKDVTDSTNNDADILGKEGAPHGTLIVSDRQSAGRGTHGRNWQTPGGDSIAMSIILRPDAPTTNVPMLTLVMGLSVAEGLDAALGETVTDIKWPNDVVIGGKKICGILTELHMNPDNIVNNVVIGVGINVGTKSFPKEIEEIAGSLFTQTGKKPDRSKVVACCMECFEKNYEEYNKTYDLSQLKDQYESKLINKNKIVKIIDKNEEYEGVALGITQGGALNIRLESGEVISVNAGEVSVRGLYSYV